eukprot:scpid89652/ scgid5528/ 
MNNACCFSFRSKEESSIEAARMLSNGPRAQPRLMESLVLLGVAAIAVLPQCQAAPSPSGSLTLLCAGISELEDCVQEGTSVEFTCEARSSSPLAVQLPQFAHAAVRSQRVTGGKDFFITIPSIGMAQNGLKHCVRASAGNQHRESCFTVNVCERVEESPLSSGEGLAGNLQPSTTSFEQAPLSSGEGPARVLEPSTPALEISVADLLDNLPPPNGVPDNADEDLFPYGNNGRIKG